MIKDFIYAYGVVCGLLCRVTRWTLQQLLAMMCSSAWLGPATSKDEFPLIYTLTDFCPKLGQGVAKNCKKGILQDTLCLYARKLSRTEDRWFTAAKERMQFLFDFYQKSNKNSCRNTPHNDVQCRFLSLSAYFFVTRIILLNFADEF